jgi:hypothetical protein
MFEEALKGKKMVNIGNYESSRLERGKRGLTRSNGKLGLGDPLKNDSDLTFQFMGQIIIHVSALYPRAGNSCVLFQLIFIPDTISEMSFSFSRQPQQ